MATDSSAATPPEELAALIAAHRDDAYRLARRLVRTTAEAEDLTQTAILNTLRRAAYISGPESVKAYLLTTVRNLWRNQLRERSRRRFIGDNIAEDLPSSELAPDEQVLTNLDTALAKAALATLSERSREVIVLRYVEDLPYEELGRRLSISPVAARQRAHRARDELVGACIDCTAKSAKGSCASVRLRLGRYYRGRLTRRLRAQIELHLERCRPCCACYEELVGLYGRPREESEGEA
jgi:RNA polymerase sigma factor (sigma-70 family)